MSHDFVILLAKNAVYTIIIVAAPILGIGLLVGLMVSIFQATTQIQEQTLAFIPKIIAILLSLVFFGRWMLTRVVDFTNEVFNYIFQVVG